MRKLFQSFDRRQADATASCYTPQPIVDFMVRSVEEVLKSEFGKSLFEFVKSRIDLAVTASCISSVHTL